MRASVVAPPLVPARPDPALRTVAVNVGKPHLAYALHVVVAAIPLHDEPPREAEGAAHDLRVLLREPPVAHGPPLVVVPHLEPAASVLAPHQARAPTVDPVLPPRAAVRGTRGLVRSRLPLPDAAHSSVHLVVAVVAAPRRVRAPLEVGLVPLAAHVREPDHAYPAARTPRHSALLEAERLADHAGARVREACVAHGPPLLVVHHLKPTPVVVAHAQSRPAGLRRGTEREVRRPHALAELPRLLPVAAHPRRHAIVAPAHVAPPSMLAVAHIALSAAALDLLEPHPLLRLTHPKAAAEQASP
mmetsp:Transcript_42533/g.83147  ORF Transcript_42533/g.83147 Transcript_42533/m.83147 type:complete len:302 (+) Transcript_42533:650-1555(+)